MNEKLVHASMSLWSCLGSVDWVETISEWQAMIVGLMALAAALITVSQMKRQRAEDRQRHQDAQEREAWAARAQMPDALTEIAKFCREVVLQLNNASPEMPALPSNGIETLKLVIRHIDTAASHRTFELLSHYQVHNARLISLISSRRASNPTSPNWTQAIYDVSLLQAQVNSLYDYGRNNSISGPVGELNSDDVKTGMTNAIGLAEYLEAEARYQSAVDMIVRFHETSAS